MPIRKKSGNLLKAPCIWIIIIGVTNLNEFVVPTAANSANDDVLSLKIGAHWVYILQSTWESTIFNSFIIYPFVLFKLFYMRIAYLSSGFWNLLQYRSWGVRINIYVGGGGIAFTKRFKGAVIQIEFDIKKVNYFQVRLKSKWKKTQPQL